MGWAPLHSACEWNNGDCGAFLLHFGAGVNAQSDHQQTPLHVTANVSNCRSTAMILLLDSNIRPDMLNNLEETSATIARRTGITFPLFEEMPQGSYNCETGLIDFYFIFQFFKLKEKVNDVWNLRFLSNLQFLADCLSIGCFINSLTTWK